MPAIYLRRNDPNLSKEDKAFVQKISIGDWLERHPHDKVDVILEHLVQDLLSQHGDNVGQRVNVVGYCYGGKHALRMAGWKTTRVSAAFHPVRLLLGGDVIPPSCDQSRLTIFRASWWPRTCNMS